MFLLNPCACHVLYLEDEPHKVPDAFWQVQQMLGLQVRLVRCCAEARQLLHETEFHLFILNREIVGEHYDGVTLAREIRDVPQYRRTPILFTGRARLWQLPADIRHAAFLPKPLSARGLISAIGALLPDLLDA